MKASLIDAAAHVVAGISGGLPIDTRLMGAACRAVLEGLRTATAGARHCRQILEGPPRLRDENRRRNGSVRRGYDLRLRKNNVFHRATRRFVLRRKPGLR